MVALFASCHFTNGKCCRLRSSTGDVADAFLSIDLAKNLQDSGHRDLADVIQLGEDIGGLIRGEADHFQEQEDLKLFRNRTSCFFAAAVESLSACPKSGDVIRLHDLVLKEELLEPVVEQESRFFLQYGFEESDQLISSIIVFQPLSVEVECQLPGIVLESIEDLASALGSLVLLRRSHKDIDTDAELLESVELSVP